MDLTTATPAEIDTELDNLQFNTAKAQGLLAGLNRKIAQYSALVTEYGADSYSGKRYAQTVAQAEAQLSDAADAVEAALLAEAPFHAEFLRRGGWTRAYLVITSGRGHVHRSTSCSTCFPTTMFNRMSMLSGLDEQEIVDAAGERACTVCYASAPVELRLDRPTTVFSKDEVAAQQARAERDAKRAVAAGAKVLNAEGKELFKTERGATNAVASTLNSMVHYGPTHPSFTSWQNEVNEVLDALVLKGTIDDKDAYLAAQLDKQRAKVRKDHNAFKKTAQYASYLASGYIDEATLVEGYDPAKF